MIRRLTARIVTGSQEYVRELLECQKNSPVWELTFRTLRQLESEQYLRGKGFKRDENKVQD